MLDNISNLNKQTSEQFQELLTLARENIEERNKLLVLIGHPPAGSHADEWNPRAITWHQERQNWITEVKRMRDYIRTLEEHAKTTETKLIMALEANLRQSGTI